MTAATTATPAPTYPLFLRLAGKRVVVVGAGPVAASKLAALAEAGATLEVIAPEMVQSVRARGAAGEVALHEREVVEADLDGAWLVVAAAPPAVNRQVQAWAEPRRLFVLAVDDLEATDAFSPAVFARGGVRVALSSEGRAPALIGLLRQALELALPDDDSLAAWVAVAVESRAGWKRDGLPLAERRARLLEELLAPVAVAAAAETRS